MNFEELQNAWQQQPAGDPIRVESGPLLKMVQRNHQAMQKHFMGEPFLIMVFGLFYVPLWIWLGISKNLPWTWYLEIPAFLWVAFFLIYHRIAQRRMQPQPGDSLRESVERSLQQIDYQIQLQNRVFWWYLLPPALPMAAFFIHSGILSQNAWLAVHNIIVAGLVFWFAYELIRRGVRKQLEPRQKELQQFLQSLDQAETESTHSQSNEK